MRRIMAVAALAVGLAACGSSGSAAPETTTTTTRAVSPDECIEELNYAKNNVVGLSDDAERAIITEKSAVGSAAKIHALAESAQARVDNAAATCEAACPGAAAPVVEWLTEFVVGVDGLAVTLEGGDDAALVPTGDMPTSINCT